MAHYRILRVGYSYLFDDPYQTNSVPSGSPMVKNSRIIAQVPAFICTMAMVTERDLATAQSAPHAKKLESIYARSEPDLMPPPAKRRCEPEEEPGTWCSDTLGLDCNKNTAAEMSTQMTDNPNCQSVTRSSTGRQSMSVRMKSSMSRLGTRMKSLRKHIKSKCYRPSLQLLAMTIDSLTTTSQRQNLPNATTNPPEKAQSLETHHSPAGSPHTDTAPQSPLSVSLPQSPFSPSLSESSSQYSPSETSSHSPSPPPSHVKSRKNSKSTSCTLKRKTCRSTTSSQTTQIPTYSELPLAPQQLEYLQRTSCSRRHFATKQFPIQFTSESRDKTLSREELALDPSIMGEIKANVFKYWPLEETEDELEVWKDCLGAINRAESNRKYKLTTTSQMPRLPEATSNPLQKAQFESLETHQSSTGPLSSLFPVIPPESHKVSKSELPTIAQKHSKPHFHQPTQQSTMFPYTSLVHFEENLTCAQPPHTDTAPQSPLSETAPPLPFSPSNSLTESPPQSPFSPYSLCESPPQSPHESPYSSESPPQSPSCCLSEFPPFSLSYSPSETSSHSPSPLRHM